MMNEIRTPEPKRKFELGILFVHGIGQQRPGNTLTTFGSALYGWLFRWNCPTQDRQSQGPKLSETVLGTSSGGEDGPASATLSVPLTLADGEQRSARWLLAESWWAEAFDAPRFLDMVRWFWKVSTCLLVLQFVIPLRRHRWQAQHPGLDPARPHPNWTDKVFSWLVVGMYVGLMALAAAGSVLLSVVLLALAIAAMLPIPRIDRAVQWVVVKLSEVLGDSFVLVHCPVQYSAMRTRVARDMAWLQERSERVAVVAHSQGAAIAHQMLKDDDHRRKGLRTFITLGQGIAKLHLLQHLDWDPDLTWKTIWTRVCVCGGLLIASIPVLSLFLNRWVDSAIVMRLTDSWLALAPVLIGVLVIWRGVVIATQAVDDRIRNDLCLPGAGTAFRWVDYYASADPVSNGPLASGLEEGQAGSDTHPLPCNEVYNRGSLLTDHTAYLRNQDQFLSRVMNDLVAAAYGNAITQTANPTLVPEVRLREVGDRRRRRLRRLVVWRLLALGAGIVGSWRLPGDAMGRSLNWSMRHLVSRMTIGTPILRCIAALVIAAVIYPVIFLIWRIWEWFAVRSFFAAPREQDQQGGEHDLREPEPMPQPLGQEDEPATV